jgi:hypothetical protein
MEDGAVIDNDRRDRVKRGEDREQGVPGEA